MQAGIPRKMTDIRFDAVKALLKPHRLEQRGECWIWLDGASQGYGVIKIRYKVHRVHVYVYETLIGKLPIGKELHHYCEQRRCLRHTVPLTKSEHMSRQEEGD